jgi:DNA-binding IscR family transcriptional regulator
VGEILTAIDGPESPPRNSTRPASRVLAGVWADVRAAERSVLDKTTIAQLSERALPREWVI